MNRGRRLRANPLIRGMVRETRASKSGLIYPIFFEEGENIKSPIESLDGQFRVSPDRAEEVVDECLKSGVDKFLLFGIPKEKDEYGSQAYAENGIVQQALRKLRDNYKKSVYLITDVCMCEYTSHGHCGILSGEEVENDVTLTYLQKIALSHTEAGADMVAPSDMMDGRIAAIRQILDDNGYLNTPVMSYAVKYASSFYGPFREAAGSAPAFGDRKGYQMDCANMREAMKEAAFDEEEGADILMVKPALAFLDVIRELSYNTNLPIATYSVSGEYAMIRNAAKAGLINEYGIICETATSMFRAGADIIISYYAKEIAEAIARGDIG